MFVGRSQLHAGLNAVQITYLSLQLNELNNQRNITSFNRYTKLSIRLKQSSLQQFLMINIKGGKNIKMDIPHIRLFVI